MIPVLTLFDWVLEAYNLLESFSNFQISECDYFEFYPFQSLRYTVNIGQHFLQDTCTIVECKTSQSLFWQSVSNLQLSE